MYAGKLIFSQRQFSDSFLWGFRLRSFHLRNDSTDHAQYLYRAHSGRFRVSALRDLADRHSYAQQAPAVGGSNIGRSTLFQAADPLNHSVEPEQPPRFGGTKTEFNKTVNCFPADPSEIHFPHRGEACRVSEMKIKAPQPTRISLLQLQMP